MVNTILAGQNRDTALVKQMASDTAEIKSIAQDMQATKPKRYGFRIKKNESDPDTRVEYIFDAVNMTPAKMESGSFNYGSWKDIWFVKGNYPVMLKKDGTEGHRLNPNDYSKNMDGTTSEVGISTTADAMAAIPCCWVKRYEDEVYQYFIVCEERYDDSYHAFAHTKKDGTIAAMAYGPMFEGSIDGTDQDLLRSLSGKTPVNTKNATWETTAAAKDRTGGSWTIWTWALRSLVQDLCILISKTNQSELAFGHGHTTGGTSAVNLLQTGTLNTKGQFWGDTSGTTQAMKVFHMENFWADRWERLVGLVYSGGTFMAKMTPENSGYNLTGENYASTGIHITSTTNDGSGWQKGTVCTEYGTLPKDLTGSDSTYECDYCWYNNSIVAVCLAGGACNCGAGCGVRCLSANALASGADWPLGASLNFV